MVITKRHWTMALIVLTLFYLAFAFWLFWDRWQPDFAALYYAASFFGAGETGVIYDAPARGLSSVRTPPWEAVYAAAGHEKAMAYPYVYPPLWAALFQPIASVPPMIVFNTLVILHMALVLGSVVLAYLLAGQHVAPLAWGWASLVLVATSIITNSAMLLGQPQIWVVFLILLSFLLYQRGVFVAAGAVLAVAAALKLMPAALALIFLLDRQWRAMAAFVLVGGALAALSVILAGWPLHAEFLTRLEEIRSAVIRTHLNWALEAALFEMQVLFAETPALFDPAHGIYAREVPVEPRWIGIAALVFLVVSVAAVLRVTRDHAPEDRTVLRLAGLYLAVSLAGPVAWSHHFLLPVLLLPMLLGGRNALLGRIVIILVAVLISQALFGTLIDAHPRIFVQSILDCGAMLIALFGFLAFRPGGVVAASADQEISFALRSRGAA